MPRKNFGGFLSLEVVCTIKSKKTRITKIIIICIKSKEERVKMGRSSIPADVLEEIYYNSVWH